MILSATGFAWAAVAAYGLAAWPGGELRQWPRRMVLVAAVLHALALLAGAGVGTGGGGLRLGFATALSLTVWLVLVVYAIESRFAAAPGVRRVLALCAAAAVALAWAFPGEVVPVNHSRWAPLHWVLGLASYGLFGAAVLHGLMLDSAERQLRLRTHLSGGQPFGMPLLKIERLMFRFVEAGFGVLTLALLIGLAEPNWRWSEHKTVLSLLGWGTFAALIGGRLWRGWRGLQATRWLYAGALLLLLAYVGSRFVLQVLLQHARNSAT